MQSKGETFNPSLTWLFRKAKDDKGRFRYRYTIVGMINISRNYIIYIINH